MPLSMAAYHCGHKTGGAARGSARGMAARPCRGSCHGSTARRATWIHPRRRLSTFASTTTWSTTPGVRTSPRTRSRCVTSARSVKAVGCWLARSLACDRVVMAQPRKHEPVLGASGTGRGRRRLRLTRERAESGRAFASALIRSHTSPRARSLGTASSSRRSSRVPCGPVAYPVAAQA